MVLTSKSHGLCILILWTLLGLISNKASKGHSALSGYLVKKIANALAPGFLAIVLGIYSYNSATGNKVEQPEQALAALKSMVTLVPAAFLFLQFWDFGI